MTPAVSRDLIRSHFQACVSRDPGRIAFRDGKLIEFHRPMDSFDAAEQVLGHPIEVAPAHATQSNVFAV